MKALLLAGGRGVRMQPLTHTSNKHAIPIANKPLIEYPFEIIVDAGIKDIAVVVNETREEIEEILGDGSRWGVKVSYIFQDHPGGLAHALSLSEKFMGNSKFVMVLGDNILQKGIKKYVNSFKRSKINGHILGVKLPREEHQRCGMATVTEDMGVLRYTEKPGVVDMSDLYDPDKSYAVPGFYLFDKNVFKCFKGRGKIQPSARDELEIASAYNWLIEHGYPVTMDLVKGWYKDPGNPEDVLITNQIIIETMMREKNEGEIDEDSKVAGKVRIEEGTVIKKSVLRGPLAIGKNCKIEDSYIGPFTSIYHDTEIKNCEIENSIILGNVKIAGVEKRLDSSIIGWNAEVGRMDDHGTCINLFIGDDSVVKL